MDLTILYCSIDDFWKSFKPPIVNGCLKKLKTQVFNLFQVIQNKIKRPNDLKSVAIHYLEKSV
jgi:hypothetical protein